MIKIWKEKDSTLVQTAILERDCLLQVVSPTEMEIESIRRDYGIPDDVFGDILDVDERSRSEKEKEYTLLIIRFPVVSRAMKIPYHTIPLGIILLKDIVITVCREDADLMGAFRYNGKKDGIFSNQNYFILRVLNYALKKYLGYLKDINKQTGFIEQDLQGSIKNNELIKLLDMEKSLVYFTTSLKSNELLLEKLIKTYFKNISEKEADLLEDVVTDSRQAIEMSNIYSNILSGMMDAFASVISNNLNTVMKRLTMISIILMIPTLFASLYGMNVSLPFQHTPLAFAGIMGTSILASILGSLFFLGFRGRK